MNISPINLVNFKSTVRNTQSSKQAETNVTSPINYASVTPEVAKANYCPQIAYTGKIKYTYKIKEDPKRKIKLQKDILDDLRQVVYKTTGKELDSDLAAKLENGTATEQELIKILAMSDRYKGTVAHNLVRIAPELYLITARDLSSDNKDVLLDGLYEEMSGTTVGDLIEFYYSPRW